MVFLWKNIGQKDGKYRSEGLPKVTNPTQETDISLFGVILNFLFLNILKQQRSEVFMPSESRDSLMKKMSSNIPLRLCSEELRIESIICQ